MDENFRKFHRNCVSAIDDMKQADENSVKLFFKKNWLVFLPIFWSNQHTVKALKLCKRWNSNPPKPKNKYGLTLDNH